MNWPTLRGAGYNRPLPGHYGKWKTVHKRFTRWAKAGVGDLFPHTSSAIPTTMMPMVDGRSAK
ncbi:MAG: hypothetical protein COA37_15185 [Hoeflea sp.]|nr:MAG: hypothetical protein COA37_15185 [Hoeflea sp.]